MKIDNKLIEKYNLPIPRYTSYPTANHFTNQFNETDYLDLIKLSNSALDNSIAFYIHIPFCKKICYYCGCNACILKSEQIVKDYIEALKNEIVKVISLIDRKRKISQIHFGGGTPNVIQVSYIEEIVDLLKSQFSLIENPEIAIECNPAHLTFPYIERLIKTGFNRFSLGIQDFDNEVLKNVNRSPSAIPIKELIDYFRQFEGVAINLDFIYGLPLQNEQSFAQTITQAIDLKPDRLVTFSYAHVPWVKKHQLILVKKGLPTAMEKMQMFLISRDLLLKAGYKAIGLDHYVLPNDELHLALESNLLHRNFQGYCTRRTTGQVYAFGVSAISQLENGYSQNFKDISEYIHCINKNVLPVEKGYIINKEQVIIKNTITEIMCNNEFNLHKFADKYKISMQTHKKITGFSEDKLTELINDNLVEYENDTIRITDTGKLFIRNIAVLFDPEYKNQTQLYSKTV